jgi:hypothetical protein
MADSKTVTEKDVKGKTFIAKAEALVVNVGKRTERYVYKNAVIPAEVEAEELVRLVRRGLVVEATVPPVVFDAAAPQA